MMNWQRKIKLEPGLQMILHDIQTPPNSEQLQHHSSSPGHTWRAVVKRNSSSSHNFKQCTWLFIYFYFSWMGEWQDVWLYTSSLTVDHGLAGWPGTWKKHDWKIGNKKYEVLWELTSLIEQKIMKIVMSHVNFHQKVTLLKKYFNN